MKLMMGMVAAILCISTGLAQEIVVQKLQGDVRIRHGVTETWTTVNTGDALKPDDTMRTGKKGSAVLVISAAKRILLPPEVMVDMSDIRVLTQEELMLKLAMERVRASSYQWKSEELRIPNVTVVHGDNEAQSVPLGANDPMVGTLQLNGARVLYNNGFFSTCALKTLDVFRLYPPLAANFNNRLMVAQSLEKANLRGEALNEYLVISKEQNLSQQQSTRVAAKIRELRKQTR